MSSNVRIFVGLASEQVDRLKAMSPEELVAYVAGTYGMTELNPENFYRHRFLSGVVPENQVDSISAQSGVDWVEVDSVMKAI